MKSEAYNMDCIEYMRSLSDNAFEIAVCDPPYGKGNDESLVGKGGGRFGGIFRRYDKPMEQTAGRTESALLQASGHTGSAAERGRRDTKRGGVKPKRHNGMSPLRRSSLTSFSASAAIR